MNKTKLWMILIFIALTVSITHAKNVDVGISVSDGKIRDFYLSISDYYRVPEREVIIIRERAHRITEEEIPVVLLISREAMVAPERIIELRKLGYSWYEIMIRYRVYPEVVFREYIIYGPPYGKAWGHYKKKKKKHIKYTDRDIIALANIKFISEYYREDPKVVIKYKERYPSFVDVHYEVKAKKKYKHKEKYEDD